MIQDFLSAKWAAGWPVLSDHIWQSTLFAIMAGLLTLPLRGNSARTRCWLWRAASIKFMLPFALLVGFGSHLASPRAPSAGNSGLFFAIEQMSQPFTPAMTMATPRPAANAAAFSRLVHLLPVVLPAIWLTGFIAVLGIWFLHWRQVAAVLREAKPLREGRELDALRRQERFARTRKPLAMVLSQTSFEPGIVGILRPVLMWPAGISKRLEDTHLEAILAHELWHARRRDNLAAAIHMVVEALFWFHPLVWWLGARLTEERERACDEQVLESGSERAVYAESILKTCEFCVGLRLACVSGITGADLKKRIVRIMTERMTENLSLGRKLLLAGLGTLAVAAPVVFGGLHVPRVQAQSQQISSAPAATFEVASIKQNKSGTDFAKMLFTPSGMSVENLTVHALIRNAYQIQDSQLIGGPGWLNSDKYDVEAKVNSALAGGHYPVGDRRLALQQLLADRFKLKIHRETRELPVYELVIAKNGPKFKEAKPGDTYMEGAKRHDGRPMGPGIWMLGVGNLASQGEPLATFITVLSRSGVDRPILDKTDLKGHYDLNLQWTPEPSGSQPGAEPASSPEASGLSLFVALEEQLGLKLETKKGPVEVLVIDHIEKPSEN